MIDQPENDQQQSQTAGSSNAANENTDTSALHLADSTLQNKEEFELDKNQPHADDANITVAGIDDLKSDSDRAAGTDRAGTAERKPFGDTELNKGLESQAKDGESGV